MPRLYETVATTKQECVGFTCDRCERHFDDSDFVAMNELLEWTNIGGYGSIWGDGTRVEVTLCQDCTHTLFAPFARLSQAGA